MAYDDIDDDGSICSVISGSGNDVNRRVFFFLIAAV